MKEHLTAVKWDPDVPPYSFFLLRNLENNRDTVYRKSIELNQTLNLAITDEKICIGHSIDKNNYYLCSNIADEKYNRCYSCEQNDFEKCFLLCDASKPYGNCANNPAAYKYCKSHLCSVYLAMVGNEIKVGVSFSPRKRWINQGADVAIEVFRAKNGFEARILEKEISKSLGITQAIRKTLKAKKLNFDLSKSITKFHELKAEVVGFLKKQNYVSQESNLLYKETTLAPYYGDITNLSSNPILNEVEKTKQIVGKVVGVKGKLLVTQINNSYYVTNLSKIIGRVIHFSDKPLKLKGQKSLSDFFG
ncbi:MAG: DUF2797 domain-containing protein [Candidatus Heimdallarchaeota archaeon]|nr:DUF2797 domain-containing protein [Candidatus Heimdallarchaeota archaeon]